MSQVAGQLKRKEFRVDTPFTKTATTDEGDLVLEGYASTWVQDRDGDHVDPKAFDESLPDYLAKNPILLYQHNHDWGLGFVTEASVDDNGLKIKATVPKPTTGEESWKFTAYENARRGIYRTFSIGGFFFFDVENIGEDDEKWIIRKVELFEISVVSVPSNPDSIFEAAMKSYGRAADGPVTELSGKALDKMRQLLGADPITDPGIVLLSPEARKAFYGDLAAIFERARGFKAPDYDKVRSVLDGAQDGDLTAQLAAFEEVAPQLKKLMLDRKAGRALSQANESKIRAAHESLVKATEGLSEVLSAVGEPDGDEGD